MVCPECGRNYEVRDNFRKHVKQKHPLKLDELVPRKRHPKDTGSHLCGQCGKHFSSQQNIDRHQRDQHRIDGEMSRDPLFESVKVENTDFCDTDQEIFQTMDDDNEQCLPDDLQTEQAIKKIKIVRTESLKSDRARVWNMNTLSKCIIPECGADGADRRVRLFHFPRGKDRIKQWTRYFKNPMEPEYYAYKFICHRHFPSHHFMTSERLYLNRKIAMPTIHTLPEDDEYYFLPVEDTKERCDDAFPRPVVLADNDNPADSETMSSYNEESVLRNDENEHRAETEDKWQDLPHVWCRLCAYPNNEFKQPIRGWLEMLKEIIPYSAEVDDGLPQHICRTCAQKLYTCCEFRNDFIVAYRRLKAIQCETSHNRIQEDASSSIEDDTSLILEDSHNGVQDDSSYNVEKDMSLVEEGRHNRVKEDQSHGKKEDRSHVQVNNSKVQECTSHIGSSQTATIAAKSTINKNSFKPIDKYDYDRREPFFSANKYGNEYSQATSGNTSHLADNEIIDEDGEAAIVKSEEDWEYSYKLCRLCATYEYPKQLITGWIGIIEDVIPDVVKVNDGLPQHICYSCSKKLHTCLQIKYEFLSACDKLQNMSSLDAYHERQSGSIEEVALLTKYSSKKEDLSIEKHVSNPTDYAGDNKGNTGVMVWNQSDTVLINGSMPLDRPCDQNDVEVSYIENSACNKELTGEATSHNQTEAKISNGNDSAANLNNEEDHRTSNINNVEISQHTVFCQVNSKILNASTPDDLNKSVSLSHELLYAQNKPKSSTSDANKASMDPYHFKAGRGKCIYSYICPECEIIFTSKSVLHYHKLNDHKELLKCKICKRCYRNKNMFESHLLTHTCGKISCVKCDRTFRTEKALSNHFYLHDPPKYDCPTCGRKFKVKGKLISHMTLHNLNLQQVCTVCGKYLKDEKSLEVHMRLHTGEKPFQCQFCGKAFSSNGALNGHEKFHKGPAYLCSHCGAQFHHTGHYKKHLVLHSVDYQNECPVCFLNFRLPKYRDKHYNSLCSKKCFCIVCKQKFQDFDSLVAHRSNSHTKEDIQTAAEKYKVVHIVHCNICSMEVHGKSGLVLHMKKAHGIVKKSSKHDLLKVAVVQEVQEVQEAPVVQMVQEAQEVHEVQMVKEEQEVYEVQDTQEVEDVQMVQEVHEIQMVQEVQEVPMVQEVHEVQMKQETQEVHEIQEVQEAQDCFVVYI